MSKALRLPSIINNFIVEKWLDDNPVTVSQAENSSSSSQPRISSMPSFSASYDGFSLSDNNYFIPASTALPLPRNSQILITDWNLFYSEGLHLVILQAEVQSEQLEDTPSKKISLKNNPLISTTLKRFKFQQLQKKVKKSFEQVPEFCHFQSFPLKHGESSEKYQKKKGNNEFNRVKEESDDDIFDMIDLSTADQSSKANASDWNIGIEQFPDYALEYLKHKYNLI
jgi:hypothetical protein